MDGHTYVSELQDIEPLAKKAKTCKDDKENLLGRRQNTTKISKATIGRNSKPNSHVNSTSMMRHKIGNNGSKNRNGINTQMKSQSTVSKTAKKVTSSATRSALQPVGNKINTKTATKPSVKKTTTKTNPSKTVSNAKPCTIEGMIFEECRMQNNVAKQLMSANVLDFIIL